MKGIEGKQITWSQLKIWLKSVHNPRFCSSLEGAKALIEKGPDDPVDALSVIGGFPFIVNKAAPGKNKKQHDAIAREVKVERDSPQKANVSVDTLLGSYVDARKSGNKQRADADWASLESYLDLTFNANEQAAICKLFTEQLFVWLKFFIAATQHPKVWLVMMRAADMTSTDNDLTTYSRFGKCGGQRVGKDAFKNIVLDGTVVKSPAGIEEMSKKILEELVYIAGRITGEGV